MLGGTAGQICGAAYPASVIDKVGKGLSSTEGR